MLFGLAVSIGVPQQDLRSGGLFYGVAVTQCGKDSLCKMFIISFYLSFKRVRLYESREDLMAARFSTIRLDSFVIFSSIPPTRKNKELQVLSSQG